MVSDTEIRNRRIEVIRQWVARRVEKGAALTGNRQPRRPERFVAVARNHSYRMD